MARSRLNETQVKDEDFLSEEEAATLSGHLQSQIDNHAHNEYITTDGDRGFTSTVSGVDPTESYHLATKNYVDNNTSEPSSKSWTIITSNYTASTGDNLLIDSSISGSFTVILPSNPSQSDEISFIDMTGSCGTYPVTISGNGRVIMSPGPYVAPAGDGISLNFALDYATTSGDDVDFDFNSDIKYFIDEDNETFSLIYSTADYGWRLF